MYVLPQAGILTNNLLEQHQGNHNYYQVKHTPELYCHLWRPISFTLLVKNVVIVYVARENANHLMSALKIYYEKLQHIGKVHSTVLLFVLSIQAVRHAQIMRQCGI